MRVDLFDFDLPPERIAYAPVYPRDTAKLLHVGSTLRDLQVLDLPSLVQAGDVLVMNDSRVIPARLFTQIREKQVEVLLHQPTVVPVDAPYVEWTAFAKPAKKLKLDMVIHFAEDFSACVVGRTEDGQVRLRFPMLPAVLFAKLRQYGHIPLPPYIARADEMADKEQYQTVYAAHDGSVAAPTAGLHFTDELLCAIRAKGVHIVFVTLHVGAGTFQPVKVDDTDEHVMHQEYIELSHEAAEQINRARKAGGNVIAVGTTSLRILESVAAEDGYLQAYCGHTGIFITPGYRFKIVDRLMTNFHLPKSTLFMLVSAFSGLERMHAAYQHAISHRYRFYSYGDTSLLERAS